LQFSSFSTLFFIRKTSLVGEKVNSLEKLVDVGKIVDRGSCFGRVFCTDATIATVRPARTGGHIWAWSYGVVWARLTRFIVVSLFTDIAVRPTNARGSRFVFLSSKLWFYTKCRNSQFLLFLLQLLWRYYFSIRTIKFFLII